MNPTENTLQTLLEDALRLSNQRSTLQHQLEEIRTQIVDTEIKLQETLKKALETKAGHPLKAPPLCSKIPPTPTPHESLSVKSAGKTKTPPSPTKVTPENEPHPTHPNGLRDTKKQDIARQIETLLKENPNGLRVDQIAEKTGRSQSNIYVWLTGRAHEYISQLKKVGPGTWAITP